MTNTFQYPKIILHPTGKKITLEKNRVLLSFKDAMRPEIVATTLANFQLELVNEENQEQEIENYGRNRPILNQSPHQYWAYSPSNGFIEDENFLRELSHSFGEKLDWLSPVYRYPETSGIQGLFAPLPQVLVVEIQDGKEEEAAQEAARFGLEKDDYKSRYLPNYEYYEFSNLEQMNAYLLREEFLGQEDIFKSVRFENMPMVVPIMSGNDPQFGAQWNMTQINADTIWSRTTGAKGVTIAILDSGVDTAHRDFLNERVGVDLDDISVNGGLPYGGSMAVRHHGTRCAGLAAATYNNNIAIAGLAGTCSILPLSFKRWTDVECGIGITYAAANRTDVISMSFGVYDFDGWDYAIIDTAIEAAHYWLDIILCAASGNENLSGELAYPSRHPLVMAVGGSNQSDQRAKAGGSDPWGANYGSMTYGQRNTTVRLSVVAPAVACPTLEVGGGTISGFERTSCATPHVAGLAALLRSEFSLPNTVIRNIIELSAYKTPGVAFSGGTTFPNGSWNEELGYGRIDVSEAFALAAARFASERVHSSKVALVNPLAETKRYQIEIEVVEIAENADLQLEMDEPIIQSLLHFDTLKSKKGGLFNKKDKVKLLKKEEDSFIGFTKRQQFNEFASPFRTTEAIDVFAKMKIKGGQLVRKPDTSYIELKKRKVSVFIELPPYAIYPVTISANYQVLRVNNIQVKVSQMDENGQLLGNGQLSLEFKK